MGRAEFCEGLDEWAQISTSIGLALACSTQLQLVGAANQRIDATVFEGTVLVGAVLEGTVCAGAVLVMRSGADG